MKIRNPIQKALRESFQRASSIPDKRWKLHEEMVDKLAEEEAELWKQKQDPKE